MLTQNWTFLFLVSITPYFSVTKHSLFALQEVHFNTALKPISREGVIDYFNQPIFKHLSKECLFLQWVNSPKALPT